MSPRTPSNDLVRVAGAPSEPFMVNRAEGKGPSSPVERGGGLTTNDLIYKWDKNKPTAFLLETTTPLDLRHLPSVLSTTTTPSAVGLATTDKEDSVKPTESQSTTTTTEAFVIYPGPEDVTIQRRNGIFHQQSVTMVAQLYPPAIEASPTNTIWGLPALAWGVLIGCSVLIVLAVTTIFLCCWLLPRSRKLLSPSRLSSTRTQLTNRSGPRVSVHSTGSGDNSEHQRAPGREIIMAHSTSNGNGNMAMNGVHPHHAMMYHQSPPQYNPPPVPPPKGSSVCSQTQTTTTFLATTTQQQQQQYCQMQAAYQRHQKQANYCSQVLQQQQQNYHNYYRVNPSAAYQNCSKHSGSSSSNDNSPKVSSSANGNNGNNGHHYHGDTNKRHSCSGGNRNSCTANFVVAGQSAQNSSGGAAGGGGAGGRGNVAPEGHKSMWAINNLHSSNTGLTDMELAAYRTRSLPSWGKGNKQRPVSTTDDLEELYAKVNFSKKRRNRMRNDEAAIIALCRSKSQNLSGIPLDRDGIVVYDERTAL